MCCISTIFLVLISRLAIAVWWLTDPQRFVLAFQNWNLPGSFAKTSIVVGEDPHAAVVPLEALVSFAGVTKIFLIENGKARDVPVVLGVQGETWVEIATPKLVPGTRVVTSGQSAIAAGTPVAERAAARKEAVR